MPGKQPCKVPPRPRWRTPRINKRVLPNHRPAPHFLGDQDFSNFWSCVHVFRFPPQNWLQARFRDDSTLGGRDSELLFPANVAIRSVWQIDQPAGIAKNLHLLKGSGSSAIVPEWCCKAPDRSLDRPCGLLARVFPPALRAVALVEVLQHPAHGALLPTPKIAAICRTVSVGRDRLAASMASCIVIVS